MTDARNNNPADRLDRYLDNLVPGRAQDAAGIDRETAKVLDELWHTDSTPGPRPEFAESLRRQLSGTAPNAPQRIPRRWIRRVDLAAVAALLVAMVVITMVTIINQDSPSPLPTPDLGQIATPPATTQPQPTPVPDETALPVDTETPPTSEPTATPPVFLGGDFPEYSTLEHLVNATDLIIVGQLTGETITNEHGVSRSTVQVDQILRGTTDAPQIEVWQLDGLEPGIPYLFFLQRHQWSEEVRYSQIWDIGGNGVVNLNEQGQIQATGIDATVFRVAEAYAGQPVADLAGDIAAIAPIEPIIEELLSGFGWNPVGKEMLRIVEIPEVDQFNDTAPVRYRSTSWQEALDLSQQIGLDFQQLAGNRVQLLPWYLERRPANGQRLIEAMLLIHEQQIIGGWITVTPDERMSFGLDQRADVLGIPFEVPTPAPTPTFPVPAGETVNPVQLYDLATVDYLMFCWPWCDETLQPDELRQRIVQALDRELPVAPPDVQPTPTADYSLGPATGDYMILLFWPDAPFQGLNIALGYDRQTGRILLPFDGGWVTAPPEFIDIMAEVEPPPPPAKEKQ